MLFRSKDRFLENRNMLGIQCKSVICHTSYFRQRLTEDLWLEVRVAQTTVRFSRRSFADVMVTDVWLHLKQYRSCYRWSFKHLCNSLEVWKTGGSSVQGNDIPVLMALVTWLVFGRLNAYLFGTSSQVSSTHEDVSDMSPTAHSCPDIAARCCTCA